MYRPELSYGVLADAGHMDKGQYPDRAAIFGKLRLITPLAASWN
jgi:hypothetical protein